MKRLLNNKMQFANYKDQIDSDYDEFFDHKGEPVKYPCVVTTCIVEATAYHSFVYPEDFIL